MSPRIATLIVFITLLVSLGVAIILSNGEESELIIAEDSFLTDDLPFVDEPATPSPTPSPEGLVVVEQALPGGETAEPEDEVPDNTCLLEPDFSAKETSSKNLLVPNARAADSTSLHIA